MRRDFFSSYSPKQKDGGGRMKMKTNRPEPTVLADSPLGYTGVMPDDPSLSPASDTTPRVIPEIPNRPEPALEMPTPASESAETQPQSADTATESAGIASDQPQAQPAPATEAVVLDPPQQSEGEAVSQSTPLVSEPTPVPPAQENGTPETDQEKQENNELQATTEPQVTPEPVAPQPSTPPIPSPPSVPSLHFPFYGSNPITFDFGAQPTEERVKKKYEEWGIVGHNGIDFGLQEGTEVLACDEGTVIQAGDNGDHGISVTIKQSWGTSIYSHLQSLGVLVNDNVKKAQVIGSSGQTGFTTGPHLHFAIQPTNSDTNNGYLGYINPTPYLSETSPLPQSPISPLSPKPPDLSDDLSEEKPVEESAVPTSEPNASPEPQSPISPQPPQSPLSPRLPQSEISQEDIQKQVVAMFDARLKENSIKVNEVKKAKRDEAIQKIFSFAQEKKRITNEQVRDLLRISQSTATDYLSDLVDRGMLKTERKGRATVYVF